MPCETEYLDLLKTVGINFIDLEPPSHSDISLVKIKGRLRGDRDLLNDSETALKNFCELYTLKHPLKNIFIDLQKLDSYDLLNSFSILNAPGLKNFGLTVPDEFVNESTEYIPFKGRKQEKRRLKKMAQHQKKEEKRKLLAEKKNKKPKTARKRKKKGDIKLTKSERKEIKKSVAKQLSASKRKSSGGGGEGPQKKMRRTNSSIN